MPSRLLRTSLLRSSLLAPSLRAAAALATTAVAMTVAGCPNPEQTFEDFGVRYDELDPQQAASTSVGQVGDCLIPEPGGPVDGTYLFALSAQLKPSAPILFIAQVTAVEGGETGMQVSFQLTPLGTPYRDDDAIPVLEPAEGEKDLGAFPIQPDGSFVAAFPEITVTGLANSITPRDLTATVTLRGQICADVEREGPIKLGFFCGSLEGDVTEPVPLELAPEKNAFTVTKYDGTLPTSIVYNCNGDPALPFDG